MKPALRNALALLLLSSVVCPLSSPPSAQAAVSSAPASGLPSVVIVSSATGLSNALANAANDSTIQLAPGSYYFTNVTASAVTAMVGPLRLALKTNVTIQGNGARLIQTVTNECDFLCISNCDRIRISGISFEGTRMTAPARSGINTCVMDLIGTNGLIEIGACRFLNWPRQGICTTFPVNTSRTEKLVVRDCYFDTIGSTNTIDQSNGPDGTCIDPMRNTLIENNIFVNIVRGVELEGWGPEATPVTITIRGNSFSNILQYGIISLPDATVLNYGQYIIEGNSFDGVQTPFSSSSAVGIEIEGSHGWQLVNNKVRSCGYGIHIQNVATHAESFVISGNVIQNGFSGYGIIVDGAQSTTWAIRDGIISQNVIDSCNYGIVCVGHCKNLSINNNIISSLTGGSVAIGISPFGGGTLTNILIEGNWIYDTNASPGIATGIFVDAVAKDIRVRNNRIGACSSVKLDFRGDGSIDQDFDTQTTSASLSTLLSLSLITNAVLLGEIKAIGVSSTSVDAVNLWRTAAYRNTNSFFSNVVQVAGFVHSYLVTNATAGATTWYVDVTNRANNTLDWVLVGQAGTTINWRTRCSAIIQKN